MDGDSAVGAKQRIGDKIFRNLPKSSEMFQNAGGLTGLTRRRGVTSAHTSLGGGRTSMQGLAPSEIFQFEDFRLDRRGGLSRCNAAGAFVPVAIGSRALDILGVLI